MDVGTDPRNASTLNGLLIPSFIFKRNHDVVNFLSGWPTIPPLSSPFRVSGEFASHNRCLRQSGWDAGLF